MNTGVPSVLSNVNSTHLSGCTARGDGDRCFNVHLNVGKLRRRKFSSTCGTVMDQPGLARASPTVLTATTRAVLLRTRTTLHN